MWDNRCTMHRADPEFDQRERRIMHRVLIEGDTPY
jgi:taurine dioxygenase